MNIIDRKRHNITGDNMTITIIRAAIIYLAVIVAVRVMGKRQIGELSTHEFVIAILISAVATVPLEDNAIPLTNSLIPIMIFISLEIIESALSMKIPFFRSLFDGKPIFVIRNGILQQKQLRRLRFTVTDLLDSLRQQSVFDISEVENAIVETNGKLSVQLKAENTPLTPKSAGIAAAESGLPIAVIVDGKAVTEYFGDTVTELSAIELIAAKANKKIKKVMLLTIDEHGKVYVINKEEA